MRFNLYKNTFSASVLFFLISICQLLYGQEIKKSRAIILTDIEADADDSQSLIRLLLYSNVIDIKGIIATTSTHQKENVYPESIQKIIRAYGKVHVNLLKHETGFPDANSLAMIVKQGSACIWNERSWRWKGFTGV